MTHRTLTVLNGNAEEQTFGDQVATLRDERRGQLVDSVKKWMLFWTDFGATKLYLDEFPVPLSQADREHVLDWLEEQEFRIDRPRRFSPRCIIHLEAIDG